MRISLSGWRGRMVGYEVSAYVVRGVLIDAGFPGARDEMMAAVRVLKPRGCVVTHEHEDHSGNVQALAAEGVPLRMHAACEATMRVSPPIGMYRRIVWGHAPMLTSPLVSFDPAPLQILSTPGHTSDHLCIWDAERRILASGDLFLGVKVRVAHVHESPRRLVASLRRAAALDPRLLLDAHRGPVTDPVPMLRAKIDWLEDTIGKIERLAGEGMTERRIARSVLGAEPFVGLVSFGEYSKRGLVHAVLHDARLPDP